jgi:hypothetical protein
MTTIIKANRSNMARFRRRILSRHLKTSTRLEIHPYKSKAGGGRRKWLTGTSRRYTMTKEGACPR